MSIFAPTDVLSPIERRKALVQKLMGQYSASAQAAQQTAMPGAAGQAAGVGSPFHGGTGLIGPRTAVTNINALSDIAPGIRAALGPGGFHNPLPIEASGSAGAPVDAPGLGMVNAPSQLPPGRGGPPVGNAGGAPVGVPAAPAAAPAGPIGGMSSSGFAPLGGGLYFDPTTQSIQQVGAQNPQQVMGQAARDLATGNAPLLRPSSSIAY